MTKSEVVWTDSVTDNRTGRQWLKDFKEAVSRFRWRGKSIVEIHLSGPSEVTPMMQPMCAAAVEAEADIAKLYGGRLTDENVRDVAEAYRRATADLKLPVVDMRPSPDEQARRDALRAKNDQERAEREARDKANFEQLQKLIPEGMKGMLVAELHEDESDSQSDYHGHRTVRRMVIGFQKSTRNNFALMRKAAALFPETEHLGPGKDKFMPRLVWNESDGGQFHKGDQVPAPWYPDAVLDEAGERRNFSTMAAAEVFMLTNPPTDPRWVWRVGQESFEHREDYSMGAGLYLKDGHRDASGWEVSLEHVPTGPSSCPDPAWLVSKTVKAVGQWRPVEAGGETFKVEKHVHSKKGTDLWLVIPVDRLSRDSFESVRGRCEASGGYYSRAWGKTPGGFCFPDEAAAVAFMATLGDVGQVQLCEPAPADAPASAPARGDQKTADRFRDLAEGCDKVAAEKMAPRREGTHKQRQQASWAYLEGRWAQATAKALRALADGWERGDVPEELRGYKAKSAILDAVKESYSQTQSGYYQYFTPSGEYRDKSPAAVALRAYAGIDGMPSAEAKLRQALAELRSSQIEGFFPTPEKLAKHVVALIGIGEGMTVMEPSAGIGDLALAAQAAGGKVWCIERVSKLAEVCELRGLTDVMCGDFLGIDPSDTDPVDRVVMNPPFERRQDEAHVRHAYRFLKPGGRLIAIVSGGIQNDRSADFREWIEERGSWLPLGPGEFKEGFRETGVSTALVILNRMEW